MLLVAVTGQVGSGKTTAIKAFAEAWAAQGKRVDGFVALGLDRSDPSRGADSYRLTMVATGQELPFADREAEGFRIDQGTQEQLLDWAENLEPGTETVVLDEFGKWELEGKGHWPLWPLVEAKQPLLVVMSVRDTCLKEIEAKLGRPFDLVLNTADGSVAETLVQVAAQRPDWQRVGVFGAGAGAMEMTAGAALHTVKFPFTGVVMSSAQAAVLTVAADGLVRHRRVVWVAIIAAGLKALSPSGSRIGPMIAIAFQGFLYTLATIAMGFNRAGVFVGGALMGAWASSQGFFIQYLMLGKGIESAYSEVVKWLVNSAGFQLPPLMTLLAIVVAANALVAGVAASICWRDKSKWRTKLEALTSQSIQVGSLRRRKGLYALGFLLPTVLVAAILLSSGKPWADVTVMVVRALAVAFLLYVVVQRWKPDRFAGWLRRKGIWGPAYAVSAAWGDKRQPPTHTK